MKEVFMAISLRFGVAVLAALGGWLLAAAPAVAETSAPVTIPAGDDSNFGGVANAANNWNFTAAAVCRQEVAVDPVLGDHVDNCSIGNVVDHSSR
ncbi:hypothetical protein [Amycolatopsis thailandensis]|uniref:hypothetical protein n=1 Tax=Amycolatopsis thailandensis TaxID=589330 RepID=UPI00363056FF